ncbi:MAG: DUF4296 domain-containing protein [Bacteroidales bacterium]|jgi:hypothetical protein|nr:DUF4296 domain-containing protein [Bacteroidales bacterium]
MKKTYYYQWILLLLAVLCCSCHTITHKKPKRLLPIDSVAVLVAESFFIESEIYIKQKEIDMKDYSFIKYSDFFERHGITKETFIQNVRYYFTSEKRAGILMNKVEEIVEQRASVLRDSLEIEKQCNNK